MKDAIDVSTLTFEEMLDVVDQFLSRSDPEAEKLWAVLTALRGPDTKDSGVKANTTERIRTRALPKVIMNYKSAVWRQATFAARMNATEIFINSSPEYGHFFDHAHRAASALGMQTLLDGKPITPFIIEP